MPPASHSTDRLPTMYGPGPFCHSCQTNQMLIINLLSNYLPDPSVRPLTLHSARLLLAQWDLRAPNTRPA